MAHFNTKKFPASRVVIVVLNIFTILVALIVLLCMVSVGSISSMMGASGSAVVTMIIILLIGGLYILMLLFCKEMLRAYLATEKNTADTAALLREHLGVTDIRQPTPPPAPAEEPAPKKE